MTTSLHHTDHSIGDLLARKGATTVSVCLPARDEAATVGPIVEVIGSELVGCGLVDELLVVDDHSSDGTAEVAAAAGATVIGAHEVLPEVTAGHGKGQALWKSLHASRGDLVVWCDADITDFDPCFVVGLLGPLLTDPDVEFVKGHYERAERGGRGGGRVTELVARPVLSLLFPHLSHVVQPLSGEYAGRRGLLESLPFVKGYGVDLGLLIDVAARRGRGAIAQVDLGTRVHRNRSLAELSPQATAVLQVALRRADPSLVPDVVALGLPGGDLVEVDGSELPPLADLRATALGVA